LSICAYHLCSHFWHINTARFRYRKQEWALAKGPLIIAANDIMGLFIYFILGQMLYDVFIVTPV
jgi:hypothetical protein